MEIIFVILCTTILFLGMILLLAAKPKYAGKITGTFIVLVAVGGLLIYGYGFAVTAENLPLAIIRALLAVCGMYVGKNDLSAIAGTPLMRHGWMHLIFWLLHLFALYATASAAITTVGAEALKKLRLWLARRGQMNLIYGVHDDTIALGKQILRQKNSVVVFVDAKPEPAHTAAIAGAGYVLRTDSSALAADLRFLRAVGLGKNRDMVFYALQKDSSANIAYARKLLGSLEQKGVEAENTRLVILGKDDESTRALQVQTDRYGFGYVSVVEETELVARLLIREYPPCDRMTFDRLGRATEDFETLLVGFGHIGQAVLKQLVMNGQFEGSTFHASIFDPDCANADGFFVSRFGSLLQNYDIVFHACDARSRQMYDHLAQRADKLKNVILCTGSQKLNHEMAEELGVYFRRMELDVPIFICSHGGVKAFTMDGRVRSHTSVYDPELLSMKTLDKMAMILNHSYQSPSDKTPLENWMECDYFSRQSCRASADFADAMLRMAGVTAEQAMQDWKPTGELLLNLSKTEHLRWNAFHFCMGFSTMTEAEFDDRAAQYRQQMETEGKATIRISKNMAGHTHACLISWDELMTLSEKEEKITGQYTDYQHLDAKNVLALPELLRTARDHEV